MSVTPPVTPFGAHVVRVSGYMSASLAVTAVVVWLTQRLVAQSFEDNGILWLCLILVPLLLAILLARRFKPMSARAAQGLLLAQSVLIGLAFGMAFLPLAPASMASVFAVVAVSFGALGLWTAASRRPPSAVAVILVMCLVGFALATVLLTAFWPDGIAYLLFAFGRGPMPPDTAPSGGLEWITSVCCIMVFSAMSAAVLARTRQSFVAPVDGEAAERLAAKDARGLYADFLLVLLTVIWGARTRRR
jgi:FtsH-binding integral membrane protein